MSNVRNILCLILTIQIKQFAIHQFQNVLSCDTPDFPSVCYDHLAVPGDPALGLAVQARGCDITLALLNNTPTRIVSGPPAQRTMIGVLATLL